MAWVVKDKNNKHLWIVSARSWGVRGWRPDLSAAVACDSPAASCLAS